MTEIPPPDDHRMWRLLLARCHPDAGGSEELFKWAQELKEEVVSPGPLPDPLDQWNHWREYGPTFTSGTQR